MRILNGISEGLMVSGLLGLAVQWMWGISSLGLWIFCGYCLLWVGVTVRPHHVLTKLFNRTPRLPSKFSPHLVSQILARHVDPNSWSESRSSVVEACQILKRRMAISIRSLGFMVVGWIVIAKSILPSSHSWTSWLPILQGITGAFLGMGYGWWIQHRISIIQRTLS